MTMKSKAENIPTGVVVTSLSHSQAVLEPNASITLKMELQVNKAHPTLDNIVNLVFSGATQRSSFKLIMKTSAGWPELDQELLKPLKMLEVKEDMNEKKGQIVLFNKGLVEMLIYELGFKKPKSQKFDVFYMENLIFPVYVFTWLVEA
ncbi:unnamed protein product [Rotaria sp. Silwood1]|nr:unnamed protein product [Rotaria sp. Silwood1]